MEAPTISDVIANAKTSYNLIYCSQCKNIPEIKIENKGKEILCSKICKCKPKLEKSINDFMKILFNKKEKKELCQKDNNHGIASEFCTECLKWYCSSCSKEHSSFAFNHITIKSEENIELNSLCENEKCQNKGRTEFYCKNCFKNLCRKCNKEHNKEHEIIIYEDFFKDENILSFKNDVKDVSNWIKENNSEYSKIINDIENVVKNIKRLLEKKIERTNNYLKLFESIIDTYDLTNKINNYQIRKNILNVSSIKDIFQIDEKNINDSLIAEIKKLNKIITDFIGGKTKDNISYSNLFYCPTCKDNINIESIDTKELEFKIKFNCPKNSHKFENKNLFEFITENKQNIINFNYLCNKHNESYKYFCLKCNVNFCEKCKEHEKHKDKYFDLSKEVGQINDINNKKINNKKDLENIDILQKEYDKWIKEFDLKMTNYFENIKFILNCKDEMFNNLENKKYNYSYIINCIFFINKLQINKKFEPKYLPKNLPHFKKYGYDVLKFIGFNAEGRPKYLCPSCYEKLGKPETYTSYFPTSWCGCGRDLYYYVYCFVCARGICRCNWCDCRKGNGELAGIYYLKQ